MVDNMTRFEALKLAIERLGSQAALARVCSVSTTAVWKWLQTSKQLPPEYVLRVEAKTGVSRHALRPDIYPIEPIWTGFDAGAPDGDFSQFSPPVRFHAVDRRVSRVAFNTQPVLKGRVA